MRQQSFVLMFVATLFLLVAPQTRADLSDNQFQITVPLYPKIKDGRFIGLKADPDKAKTVEFKPGDDVTFTIARVPDGEDLTVEKWNQSFKTQRKKGGFLGFGGHKEVKHYPVEQTWSVKWGRDIDAVVSGADPDDFIATIGLTSDKASYRCNTVTAAGQFQFDTKVNSPPLAVSRDGVPGDAKPESDKPTVQLQVAENQKVGELTITITRPSSAKPPSAQ